VAVTKPSEHTSTPRHIRTERLSEVANDEQQEFSAEEFHHLKYCAACRFTFSRLVHQHLTERNDKPPR
jgi:hypothetical protein